MRRRRRRWRRGEAAQAKDSTDIHGNLQIYSLVIININVVRGRGKGGVGEFMREGPGGREEEDGLGRDGNRGAS